MKNILFKEYLIDDEVYFLLSKPDDLPQFWRQNPSDFYFAPYQYPCFATVKRGDNGDTYPHYLDLADLKIMVAKLENC